MKLLAILVLASSLQASELYRWSVASLIASNIADAVTSYGARELNPLLSDHGRFDGRSVAIKSGIVAGELILQHFLIHHHPRYEKVFTYVNLGTSAGLAGVAWHNEIVRE